MEKSSERASGTIKVYNGKLKKLRENNINLSELDFEKTYEFLKTTYPDPSTLSGYISAIFCKIREIDIKSRKLERFKRKFETEMSIQQELRFVKATNKDTTDIQNEKFTTWPTIVNIFNILTEKLNFLTIDRFDDSIHNSIYKIYAMLALYVLMPCRRVKEYATLTLNDDLEIDEQKVIDIDKIGSDEYLLSIGLEPIDLSYIKTRSDYPKKIIEEWDDDYYEDDYDEEVERVNNEKIVQYLNSNPNIVHITEEEDKANYYSTKGYMKLDKYKTEKKYGEMYLKLPAKLTEIINKHIKLFNVQPGQLVFPTKSTKDDVLAGGFSRKIPDFFEKIIGKRTDATTFRHIFIMYIVKNTKSSLYRQIIAKLMAHSLDEQEEYNKKDIFDDIPEETLRENIGKVLSREKVVENKLIPDPDFPTQKSRGRPKKNTVVVKGKKN